jgi:hypothetical protein
MWGKSRQDRERQYLKERAHCKYCDCAIHGRHGEDYGRMLICMGCLKQMQFAKHRRRTKWLTISA